MDQKTKYLGTSLKLSFAQLAAFVPGMNLAYPVVTHTH